MRTEPEGTAEGTTQQTTSATLGGAVGGCVVLLALVALTIGVVAVLFKYLKPKKSYFGVERNNTVTYNNSIYGHQDGKVVVIQPY